MSYTAKHVLALADRAAKERGEGFREERGQYLKWSIQTTRWEACCLVGAIALACEVPIPELVMVNSESVSGAARVVFARRFTDHAIDLLQTMQRATDKGATWAEAVDEARCRWADLMASAPA